MTEEEIEIQNKEEEEGSVELNPETETFSDEELKPIEVENQKLETETGNTVPNPEHDGQPEKINPAFSDEHFTQIPNILVKDVREGKLQPLDVLVYAVFVSHVGQNAKCWPGNKLVAKTVGTSVRNLGRCLERLQKAGHIGRGGSTIAGTRFTFLKTKVENHQVMRLGQPAKIATANEHIESAPKVKKYLNSPVPEGDALMPITDFNGNPVTPPRNFNEWMVLKRKFEEEATIEESDDNNDESVPF